MSTAQPGEPNRLLLGSLHQVTVGHASQGFWRHPACRSGDYNQLDYWIELARKFVADPVPPATVDDFVALVVPELRRRGLLQPPPPAALTLRERLLYGAGHTRTSPSHPSAAFRRG